MNLTLEIMTEVFEIIGCPCALRNELKLKSKKIHSVRHGIEITSLALESGTVYLVTLKSVNPLSFSSQKSKIGFLKSALANFANLTSSKSVTCKLQTKCLITCYDFSYEY